MFHLTGFQKDCLFAVATNGPCHPETIHETLDQCYRSVSRSALECALDELEADGYLERTGSTATPTYACTENCTRQLEGGLGTQIALEGPVDGAKALANMAYHNLPSEFVLQFRRWINERRHQAPPEPVRRLWIDPDHITQRMDVRAFSNRNDRGKITGGTWDTVTTEFADHPIYRGLKERFEDEIPWRETAYVQWCMLRIDGRGEAFGCTSREELLSDRCAYVDQLYHDIRTNGYQTTDEAALTFDRRRHQDATEISAHVGRDGKLLLYDGHHRLAIAKLLNLESVPIELVVRHREWQGYRNAVFTSGDVDVSEGVDRQRLTHPDLRALGESRSETRTNSC